MKLSLREYQTDCLEHAKKKNTIVCLPTGEGKTLIAARLIEHYLKLRPDKRVAFLVPTRPLVHQQSRYCMDHCRLDGDKTPAVEKLIGDNQAKWRQKEWDESMERCDIFLGTPAVFQKAVITDKYITVDRFSLLVFDECHHTNGNSPMASIMRDAVAALPRNDEGLPRILGLTASIINGGNKNMVHKRQELEALLNSSIICPKLESKLTKESFSYVRFERDFNHESLEEIIQQHITDALNQIGQVKEVKKVVMRCVHVFFELGEESMIFYIEKVIVQQIQEKITHLESLGEASCDASAGRLRTILPVLRDEMKELAQQLRLNSSMSCAAPQTPKLLQLLKLLEEKLFSHGDNGYRGIVFVQQVALVSALAKQINDRVQPRFQCGSVAGTGAQTETARQEQVNSFKSGKIQVLVATAALEEGIDVSECQLIIRYSQIQTTKSHIQGAGRARHEDAEIFYFENDPEQERRKEAEMSAVAQNSSLALSPEGLRRERESKQEDEHGPIYPFGSSECQGEVNVFNCKEILVRYCSCVFEQSINPKEELYDYYDRPNSQHQMLASVRYPTPNGWQQKTEDDLGKFLSRADLSKIFEASRSKRKTASQKEELCLVYLAVVELRQMELLDVHNKPTMVNAYETRRTCALRGAYPPARITLRDMVIQSTQEFQRNAALTPPHDILQTSNRQSQELTPTDGSLRTSRQQSPEAGSGEIAMNLPVVGHYPYSGQDGDPVKVDNCKQVLNEYITAIYGETVGFSFEIEMSQQGNLPTQLKVPSPSGWLYKSKDDYEEFFTEADVDVLFESMGKRKKKRVKIETCLVYLAVVELREKGHLDAHNKCSLDFQRKIEAKLNCPIDKSSVTDNSAVVRDSQNENSNEPGIASIVADDAGTAEE